MAETLKKVRSERQNVRKDIDSLISPLSQLKSEYFHGTYWVPYHPTTYVEIYLSGA